MFLRAKVRKKDGKEHRYFSVVENRRVGPKQQKRMAQRMVLYLGEINDGQEAAWRKSLEVFDESCHRYSTLMLVAVRMGPLWRAPLGQSRQGSMTAGQGDTRQRGISAGGFLGRVGNGVYKGFRGDPPPT